MKNNQIKIGDLGVSYSFNIDDSNTRAFSNTGTLIYSSISYSHSNIHLFLHFQFIVATEKSEIDRKEIS